MHMQRLRAISRTGSVAVEAGESCRLSGQQAAGPEQSRCCGSSAKITNCRIPHRSRRPDCQLTGRGPPTLGRAIRFTLGQWTRETERHSFLPTSARSVVTHQTAHRLVLRVPLSGDTPLSATLPPDGGFPVRPATCFLRLGRRQRPGDTGPPKARAPAQSGSLGLRR